MEAVGSNVAHHQRSDSTASTSSTASQRQKQLFASLYEQKRSNNPEQIARRQSMQEQRQARGVFGQWWSKYVHGV